MKLKLVERYNINNRAGDEVEVIDMKRDFAFRGVFVGLYHYEDDPICGGHVFYGHAGYLTNDVTYWMPIPEPPGDNDARNSS